MTSHQWGRVDDDGTVYVKTADGERSVGQYPEGSPEEALKFFTERYDALAFEVELLEKRVASGVMSPEEATASVRTVREQVTDANAVGDLAALDRPARRAGAGARAAARGPQGRARPARGRGPRGQGEDRRRGRERSPRAPTGATAPTGCASCSTSGRRSPASTGRPTTRCGAGSRPRARRTPVAARRTSPSSTRSATPPASVKEQLATEAESLATSTDWGGTAGRYRDLMREWKAAGPAPRDVDEALWKRFRGAQDTFFGARDAAAAEQDVEFAANAEVKEALLVEAEKLLPVTRPRRREAGLPRHRRPLGRRRQGPARPDEGPRGPDPQGRDRRSAASRTSSGGAPTPRSPPAPTTWSASSRPPSPRSRPTSRRRGPPERQEDQGARGEPRVPPVVPRDGASAPAPTSPADSWRGRSAARRYCVTR